MVVIDGAAGGGEGGVNGRRFFKVRVLGVFVGKFLCFLSDGIQLIDEEA